MENDDIGAYGEFMRVDLTGNYGGLGSWKIFKEEFDEAKAEFANQQSQATINEAVEHLKKLPLQVIN